MMVIVRLHGILREESSIKELRVGGGTVAKLLEELPEEVKRVLIKYLKYLLVIVNGRRVYDLNTTLNDDDVVDITLPVGGG